ncbi:MAG: hypothetical protein JNL60_18720 [Bacteroidia bacterium]|nr:hypothetical protein [Bacteroidia bacterium]
MFQKRTYLVTFVLVLLAGLSANACSLRQYKYCEIALGKKVELGAKILKSDGQNEVPSLKRKYKTKGIQVIIPTIPSLTIREFVYCNDFVPHLTRSKNTHFQVRANCKRGPPLT